MPVKMSRLSIQRLPNQLLSALTCITCLLNAPAYSDPIYADDFDADLPPVPAGIDASSVTGTWLLSFTDVGVYESTDYEGNVTHTEISATGRIYSLLQTDSEDAQHPLALDCLPFDSQDGSGSIPLPEGWSNQYTLTNYYYNPTTDSEKETGSLRVSIRDNGTLTGEGSFRQHPAGFIKRFNADNLISHNLSFNGIKISDQSSTPLHNTDVESDIEARCFGAMKVTSTTNNEVSETTELLPKSWISDDEELATAPYFDDYDFHAEVHSTDDNSETTYQLILN